MEENQLNSIPLPDKPATEILLIGGSAGSISVLLEIIPQLDKELSFPVIIILHRKAHPESNLSELLQFHSSLPLFEVEDKMILNNGCIYLAPADYHLLLENKGQIALDSSEKINYSRPSIDVSFQSAAVLFKQHTAGLLLSGANADGMEGLRCIEQYKGLVLVQDPVSAEFGYMPKQTLLNLEADAVLKPAQMAFFINRLNKKSNLNELLLYNFI
ncbi:chemotaxis protein CheB [Niabella hibiscisoli]|uniref:chemotaxis protein CheB n=1 Tax=Niabella hibiscisoli TaxID=1825928 RepID=UPI001F0EB3B5|nr:chemotaxis protein CheB [Niabella hibiscisoli]MCH5719686.1 chemotaxis protein CheB [Niabella hibiscisoli]